MEKQTLIGLSLSFCVTSICRREVPVENVEKIITATRFSTEAGWQEGIMSYLETYWSKFPDEAQQVVTDLRTQNKISQPRLQNNDHFPIIGNKRIWVSSEDEIQWNDA